MCITVGGEKFGGLHIMLHIQKPKYQCEIIV